MRTDIRYLRTAIPILLVIIAIALLSSFPVSAAILGTASASPTSTKVLSATTSGRIAPPRTVTVSRLAASPPSAHPTVARPFRPRDTTAFQQGKRDAASVPSSSAGGPLTRVATVSAPVVSSLQVLESFAGMSYSQQVAQIGGDQSVAPPDTQIAAGPSNLLEMVNSSGSVWTTTGTLVTIFDLNTFFGVPSGYSFSDPRVIYDTLSGRWFASGLSFDSSLNSQVYVAVSQTADPTGSWWVYTVSNNTSGVLGDQPKFGVSSDKLVISWNDYGSGGSTFTGQETYVLQKSDLLTGASAQSTSFGPDNTVFNVVPSQSLTATNTEYLVYNDTGIGGVFGVVAITGTPSSANVTWTEWNPSITATASPPDAVQPTNPTIATNDDRLLFATWQNGILWTGGNDRCIPSGDSSYRSCLRLIQLSTTGSPPSLVQSFDVGANGGYLYYPSATLDSSANAIVVATYSSASTYASVVSTFQIAGTPNTIGSLTTIRSGLGIFNWCGNSCHTVENRWGDYSGAAPDPSNPAHIWIAGEYAASATTAYDWGTGIGEVAINVSTATSTSTPTPTNTPKATSTPSPTPTSTNTPGPTNTPTSTSTPSATRTPTNTPGSTATSSPTPTPTNTPGSTSTPSATPTRTNTPKPGSTLTPTPTPTNTPGSTSTPSPTSTPTDTPSPTNTPTPFRVFLPAVFNQQ